MLQSGIIRRALVYGLIGVMGFVLLMFFSQPNRLAHDQIDHALVQMTRENPNVFAGDYVWGTPKRVLLDNYYSLRFIEWIADEVVGGGVGSREIIRWLLVPLVFLVFTIGMFELCYSVTKNILASFGAALISNIHIPFVFVTEWGLPGPTELDPWAFVAAVYPLLFLLFYQGTKRGNDRLVLLSFLLAGIVGNLHLISWFNIVGVFGVYYLIHHRFQIRSLLRLGSYVALSIIAVMPFLEKYFGSRPSVVTLFDPSDQSVWRAIREIAVHVTTTGKLIMIRQWLFDYWWFIWPAIAVFLIAVWVVRKQNDMSSTVGAQYIVPLQNEKPFLRFGTVFIFATLVFNIAFSVFQLARLYLFHQLPEFNEPRGVQLMYPVFFVAFAIVGSYVIEKIREFLSKKPPLLPERSEAESKGFPGVSQNVILRLRSGNNVLEFFRQILKESYSRMTFRVSLVGVGVVLIVALFILVFPKIKTFSYAQTHASYTVDTCDSELYRVLNYDLKSNDLLLVDPTYYGAIRVCTKHPIVVHNRDKATAYVHGSDVLMDWYRRFHEVQQAFEVGGESLISVAEKYGANVIISRQCIAVDEAKLEYSKRILHPTLGFEGCVYRKNRN